ncbi:hypothetical protein HMPREF0971_02979 [Segatella oris F0302]|uniref:Uncharacterized protein n=1 Tax=Segatella oris F0302 TaxID=649760 RepID=D1QVK1_9BACT|nr:hypothetical protein HMPREF0971_02979 [Segatella oris F0302]
MNALQIQNECLSLSKYAPFLGSLQCVDNQIITEIKLKNGLKSC